MRNNFASLAISLALIVATAGAGFGATEKVLWSFGNGSDGSEETAIGYDTLIMDDSGNIYGTTPHGGTGGFGTVFALLPSFNTRGKLDGVNSLEFWRPNR